MPAIADLVTAAEAPPAIIVTASRSPLERGQSSATVTLIDEQSVARLGEPLLSSLLRLFPSASLAVAGPAGSQSQLRIRGAEANHTLLFIDGIRANDPAAGNEPRFELLSAELGNRIEIVRGPQSALWGSEAIGGVVAVSGTAEPGVRANLEGGSFGFARASTGVASGDERLNGALAAGFQRATGIDSFLGDGERDGYRNATLRARVAYRPTPELELVASGFAIAARSQFDGYDPDTYARADTRDETRNRLAAARLGAIWRSGEWTLSGGASALASTNRNLLDRDLLNRTQGTRTTAQIQLERGLRTGAIDHRLILALETDRERFTARDRIYFGATNQDRSRRHHAFTGEWRADWGPLSTDVAIRRDSFNRFRDQTSLRAGALLALDEHWSLAASYGEGIAQPTFFDLYGFFPGSFTGNPDLRPERSRGVEASLRYRSGPFDAAVTVHRQRVRDEIIDLFVTAANASGTSRRWGIEVEAAYAPSPRIRVGANAALLRASEPTGLLGEPAREVRRPRQSGSLFLDGETGRWTYAAAVTLTGARRDFDFDVFPALPVRLRQYALVTSRLAWRASDRIELFVRGSNLLDRRYQDAAGYRTEGRGVHAGIRLDTRR